MARFRFEPPFLDAFPDQEICVAHQVSLTEGGLIDDAQTVGHRLAGCRQPVPVVMACYLGNVDHALALIARAIRFRAVQASHSRKEVRPDAESTSQSGPDSSSSIMMTLWLGTAMAMECHQPQAQWLSCTHSPVMDWHSWLC